MQTQVLIIGGGTGGCAAALAAASLGARVILTEETAWIGGQFTSQAVPPDENHWIETTGCTRRYRQLRSAIRDWYRANRSLTPAARNDPNLNPGGGLVSRICHEPRVSLAVLNDMVAPLKQRGLLTVLLKHKPIRADVQGDRVLAVTLKDLKKNQEITITADYILDATELGDLLPMTGCEYVTGAESQKQTGEPHAPASPEPENVQALTWCFPVAFDPTPGASHVIDKPIQYDRWHNYAPHLTPPWPGHLLSFDTSEPITLNPMHWVLFPEGVAKKENTLWTFRRIVRRDIYQPGHEPHEVTLVNWPQNDYFEHNVIDKPPEDVDVWLEESKQLSLSLLHWLQTKAPREDGKQGHPGLYLTPDIVGTKDGLAMAPYFRESRRIKAVFTITENHVGTFARYGVKEPHQVTTPPARAEPFSDSIGIGHYRIDLHPSTSGRNYLDISSLPFQIPLGALIPVRIENLLPACKNIGTTHITNGCYRMHPIEWNIGESAGALAAFCLNKTVRPREVSQKKEPLAEFQKLLTDKGVQLEWKI